jgi:hypothetical protein
MSNRFWAGSSSSDAGSASSEDSEIEANTKAPVASRWAIESESDSDEEVRVVLSAKAFAHVANWLVPLDESKSLLTRQHDPALATHHSILLVVEESSPHVHARSLYKMSNRNSKKMGLGEFLGPDASQYTEEVLPTGPRQRE